MIGMTLADLIGGEPHDLDPESDASLRARVLVVCADDDRRAVEIAAGQILDDLAAKYRIARRWE